MIWFYSGTPGSGKSLHVARDIYDRIGYGKTVIGNIMVNQDALKRKGRGKYIYKNDVEMTPDYLYKYAIENHKRGKEGQTLIIIDECQRLFGAREWNAGGRKEWNEFFQLHRHYGYDIILISQFDRLVDRQIRALFEYEIKHRKINNFTTFGWILGMLSGGALFVCIEYWYGVREKIGQTFFRGNRKLYKLYDSYETFKDFEEKEEVQEKAQIDVMGYDDEDLIFINLIDTG